MPMKLEHTLEIKSTPELVFDWIGDHQKARRWQPGVSSDEILNQTPDMVGTTFKETVEEDGQQLEMEGVITRYQPPQAIDFHIISRIHILDNAFHLEAIPDGTRLTNQINIRWKFPMSVMSLFIGGKIRANIHAQQQKELGKLKEFCEGTAQ